MSLANKSDDYIASSELIDVKISTKLLPEKSKKKYEAVYNSFKNWQNLKNIKSISEDVLLVYFGELSGKYKSSSLWAHYSMLRSTLVINNGVDIENYLKLRAFLKCKAEGYQAKKAKTFTSEEIHKFIDEAPDDKYLSTKVALIMGIMGACRATELHAMDIRDLEDLGSALMITVPNSNKKVVRKFTLSGHLYEIVRKYLDARPSNLATTLLFLSYQNGKCSAQNIGINKYGAMGKQIAAFLKLPNPELYTGHSFRRSSTSILGDAGRNITVVESFSANSAVYDRRSSYQTSSSQYASTSNDYGSSVAPVTMTPYTLNPTAFNAAYPPPLPPPPPPPPSYPSSNSNTNYTPTPSDGHGNSIRSHSYPTRPYPTSSRTTHYQSHLQSDHSHTTGGYDYHQRKRRNSNEMDKNKGMGGKKKKKPLSQNIPTRKDWSVEEARKALDVEKEFNKRHKSQSLIIKFPDLELNRDIVSKFHSAIDSVHFQQPSTPRFCFITLNSKASAEQVIADLNKVKFGEGYLVAEHKKDREDEMSIGPEDIDPLTLYVGNLAQEVTKGDIVKAYPKQRRVDIGFAKKMKYTRYAFVCFRRVKDAIEAFQNTHATEMYSKSLIVRFRRLHGTVGMPGEPKPQNPTKKLERSLDYSSSSLNEMDVDDNESFNRNNYFHNSDEDRTAASPSINHSSRENSQPCVDDSIYFSPDEFTSPSSVKQELDSDSDVYGGPPQAESDLSFCNSLDSVEVKLHRPKVKSEVKEEQGDFFSDEDPDDDDGDEPLPPIFNELSRSPTRNPSRSPTIIYSRSPTRNPSECSNSNEYGERSGNREHSEESRESCNSDLIHRPMLEPKLEPPDASLAEESRESCNSDLIHRPMLEPKLEPLDASLAEESRESCNSDLIHRPMLEPKVEPLNTSAAAGNSLITVYIKEEISDTYSEAQPFIEDNEKIHRPMLEPKKELAVKEEEDSGDSEPENDSFNFHNLLNKMKPSDVNL